MNRCAKTAGAGHDWEVDSRSDGFLDGRASQGPSSEGSCHVAHLCAWRAVVLSHESEMRSLGSRPVAVAGSEDCGGP